VAAGDPGFVWLEGPLAAEGLCQGTVAQEQGVGPRDASGIHCRGAWVPENPGVAPSPWPWCPATCSHLQYRGTGLQGLPAGIWMVVDACPHARRATHAGMPLPPPPFFPLYPPPLPLLPPLAPLHQPTAPCTLLALAHCWCTTRSSCRVLYAEVLYTGVWRHEPCTPAQLSAGSQPPFWPGGQGAEDPVVSLA